LLQGRVVVKISHRRSVISEVTSNSVKILMSFMLYFKKNFFPRRAVQQWSRLAQEIWHLCPGRFPGQPQSGTADSSSFRGRFDWMTFGERSFPTVLFH